MTQPNKQTMEKEIPILPVKPCDQPCPKCGGTDIGRTFYAKGEETNHLGGARQKTTAWVRREAGSWAHPARKDVIVHHCRTCRYEWDSDPLSGDEDDSLERLREDLRKAHPNVTALADPNMQPSRPA